MSRPKARHSSVSHEHDQSEESHRVTVWVVALVIFEGFEQLSGCFKVTFRLCL